MNVAVLGASPDRDKYSNMAVRLLLEKGHRVFPVNPTVDEVEGLRVFASLDDVPQPLDTVTLYVSPKVSASLAEAIVRKKPRRLIFNPGAENAALAARAEAAGVKTLDACTLVLLRTGQF
jgi:uncharacterized protein